MGTPTPLIGVPTAVAVPGTYYDAIRYPGCEPFLASRWRTYYEYSDNKGLSYVSFGPRMWYVYTRYHIRFYDMMSYPTAHACESRQAAKRWRKTSRYSLVNILISLLYHITTTNNLLLLLLLLQSLKIVHAIWNTRGSPPTMTITLCRYGTSAAGVGCVVHSFNPSILIQHTTSVRADSSILPLQNEMQALRTF